MSFDILRVLVIEPGDNICSSIKQSFSNVYSCKDPRQGLLMAKQIEPDCIVCDYDVSDPLLNINNGVDMLSAIENGPRETARILVSSTDEFNKVQKAINEAGIYRLVPKPFNGDELRSSIGSALEYVELVRENSGLVARAQARKQYLTSLHSALEEKRRDQVRDMSDSGTRARNIKTEFEIMNSLLTSIQNATSIEDLENMIREKLQAPLGVDQVKIILSQDELKEEAGNVVSTHLFCSGSSLGYIRFGRGGCKDLDAVFTADEIELFDRISDIVSMSAEKIIRFSSLKRLKEQWEAVFNSIEEPLVLVNRDFQILQANNSFARMSGADAGELKGLKCYQALTGSGEYLCCPGCNVIHTFRTGKPSGSQVSFSSRKKCYTTWAYPIFEGKEIKYVVQFYKDVSEQELYKEKISYSEKLAELGIIAGSVAHEINNPIGGVLAFLQVMMGEADKSSSLYGDLTEMEKAAKRCKQIADNLLHFSRQSRDEEVKEITLSSVFSTLLPLVQLQTRHENISINLSDHGGELLVRSVFNELVQAFLNIVNVAVELVQKRMSSEHLSGGFVNIDIFLEGGEAVVSIYDNGSKLIDDEEFQNLALFVTKRIIRDYSGRIDIGQRSDDIGNYYRVTLPVVEKAGVL